MLFCPVFEKIVVFCFLLVEFIWVLFYLNTFVRFNLIVDEMYQCVVCEDWYHSRCLFPDKVTIENDEVKFISDAFLDKLISDESEVICKKCTEKYKFIQKI